MKKSKRNTLNNYILCDLFFEAKQNLLFKIIFVKDKIFLFYIEKKLQ